METNHTATTNTTSPSSSPSHSQESDKEDDNPNFDLHDYDLDVVDSVLNNPHQTEYYDHFGFKIEVKTDDEESVDTSDDDTDNEDHPHLHNHGEKDTAPSAAAVPDEHQQQPLNNISTTTPAAAATATDSNRDDLQHADNSRRRYSIGSSNNEKSLSSSSTSASDEDEYSVDTALTTPTTHKHQRSSTSSLEFRSSHPPDIPGKSERQEGDGVPRSSSNSQHSTYSFTNSSHHPPPSSRKTQTSPQQQPGSIITFQRPSQAFRERQTKRMSELSHIMSPIRTISDATSPPRTSTSTFSKRLSSSSTITTATTSTSYYGMLKAKFKRSSNESDESERESPNQHKLRQETLKLLDQERKAQPGEYDWDFWKSMILDSDRVITTEGLALKHHISMGIPDRLRGSLWQLMAKSKNQGGDMEAVYWELLKRTSPHEKLIQHDLDTSFPMSKFFPFPTDTYDDQGNTHQHSQQYQALYHVLKVYSLFDQDVGYTPGLSFIVAVLLKQIPDEVSVFCLLVQLMGPFGLQSHLTDSTDTLQLHLYQFDHLFQLTLPELHRHVDALGIKPDMYASRWFATCFAYHCSPSLVVRVFDIILVEGAYVMQRFILALLKRNQMKIMDLGFESLMKFFQVDIFDVYKGQRNEFVIDMYQIDLSVKLYARLAKQYKNELARRMKQRTEDDEIRRANEQLTLTIQDLQEKYRVLEMEHQEMTRQAVETKMAMAKMDADNEHLTHQLKQLQTHSDHMERQKDTEHQARLEDIYKNNTQLLKHNASLQDQISDMEAVLIGLKMNFAERETEYQLLRRQLLDAQKPS